MESLSTYDYDDFLRESLDVAIVKLISSETGREMLLGYVQRLQKELVLVIKLENMSRYSENQPEI